VGKEEVRRGRRRLALAVCEAVAGTCLSFHSERESLERTDLTVQNSLGTRTRSRKMLRQLLELLKRDTVVTSIRTIVL